MTDWGAPNNPPTEEATADVGALSYAQRDAVTASLTEAGIDFRFERGDVIVVKAADLPALHNAINAAWTAPPVAAPTSSLIEPPVEPTFVAEVVEAVAEAPVFQPEPEPEPAYEPTLEPEPEPEPEPETAYETAPEPETAYEPAAEPELEPAPAPVVLGDETEFDLVDLSVEERRHLSMRLTGAGIAHRWEVGTDLVVSSADADLIAHYVEEVANPDGFADEEISEFDEDVDDEAVYAAMSNLYVAADKLMQRPGDGPSQNSFFDASDDVEGLPAPFGFDPRVWSQVLALAASIAAAMDAEGDEEAIGNDARTLRQLLVNYV